MNANLVPFGRLVRSMRNGLSPASDGAHAGEVLTLSAVTRGGFDVAARKKAMFGQEPRHDQRVRQGMFLVCRGNGNLSMVGCGVVVPTGVDADLVFPDTIIGADLDPAAIDPSYLAKVWTTQDVRTQIEAGARTTNGTHKVNQQVLEAIQIPLPGLAEQRRIAALLDEADALCRRRRHSLVLLDELLRATFVDMLGDPITNPRSWPVVSLQDIVVDGFRNGLSPSTAGTVTGRVLTLSSVTGQSFDPTEARDAVFDKLPCLDQFVQDGLFLICRGNGNLGLVGRGKVACGAAPGIIFPDTIIACRPREDLLKGAYLGCVWETRVVRDQIEAGARTTNGTHKVNQQVLANIRLPLPPVVEQLRFERSVMSIAEQAQAMERSIMTINQLFESLLDHLFSGDGGG